MRSFRIAIRPFEKPKARHNRYCSPRCPLEATVVSTLEAPPGILLGKRPPRQLARWHLCQRSAQPTSSETDPTSARPADPC